MRGELLIFDTNQQFATHRSKRCKKQETDEGAKREGERASLHRRRTLLGRAWTATRYDYVSRGMGSSLPGRRYTSGLPMSPTWLHREGLDVA